jgi:hypothetical protein
VVGQFAAVGLAMLRISKPSNARYALYTNVSCNFVMIQISILLTASNSGLIAGMIFCGVMFVILIFGVIHFVKAIILNTEEKLKNLGYLVLVVCSMAFMGHGFLLEYNLLENPIYVEGTTIGTCPKSGIEFEYYLNNERYTNCNSYKDREKIKIPGGKFKVRVSNYDPSIGRIDFDQPTTTDSKFD